MCFSRTLFNKTFEHFTIRVDQTDIVKGRAARPLPILLAVFVFAAWLLISNHCALAVVLRGDLLASEHAHCHKSQPAPENESGDEQVPCCKILRATIGNSLNSIGINAQFWQAFYYAENVIPVSRDLPFTSMVSTEFDTGPPFATSFAELILQHSLLSHAPPALV
jgi:hypothetical protein